MNHQPESLVNTFAGSSFPVFLLDEKFVIIEVNDYIINNDIPINESDSLYNIFPKNQSLLDGALIALTKKMPYNKAGFVMNGVNISMFFLPFNGNANNNADDDNSKSRFLCYYTPASELDNIASLIEPDNIYNQFTSPTMKIMNSIAPVARHLESAERYEELDYINKIIDNCYSMLRTSTSVSTYYRLVNNKINFSNRLFNLNNYLDELSLAMRLLLCDADYHIAFDITKCPIIVNCDDEYLACAIFHIVSNACTRSPSGSTIKLSLTQKGANANITIIDEGDGISSNDIDNIFDPFFATPHISPSADTKSVGVGLPIAKRIIETFGGKIFVSSEISRGTTIALSIPAVKQDEYTPPIQSTASSYVTNQFSDLRIFFSNICHTKFY